MRSVAALLLIAVAALGGATATHAGMPPAATFTSHVTNPWFPLPPGTTWSYVGVKDGLRSRDHVVVAHTTATIDGVPCAVVEDKLYLAGKLRERTTDWYSQDAHGNVWYMGEDTAELDAHGRVTSREGTWQSGRDGAQAGIY